MPFPSRLLPRYEIRCDTRHVRQPAAIRKGDSSFVRPVPRVSWRRVQCLSLWLVAAVWREGCEREDRAKAEAGAPETELFFIQEAPALVGSCATSSCRPPRAPRQGVPRTTDQVSGNIEQSAVLVRKVYRGSVYGPRCMDFILDFVHRASNTLRCFAPRPAAARSRDAAQRSPRDGGSPLRSHDRQAGQGAEMTNSFFSRAVCMSRPTAAAAQQSRLLAVWLVSQGRDELEQLSRHLPSPAPLEPQLGVRAAAARRARTRGVPPCAPCSVLQSSGPPRAPVARSKFADKSTALQKGAVRRGQRHARGTLSKVPDSTHTHTDKPAAKHVPRLH